MVLTLEAAGGDIGRRPKGEDVNPSSSLSSNSLGGTGGFILSLAFPPRGFLNVIGLGTLDGWKA